MRLVHLSDLHYTTARREEVRAMLEAVRNSGAEHLIVTGDLTHDASVVHMRGLLNLFKAAGFVDSDRLTVIPGNHDLFGFIYQTFPDPKSVVGRIRGLKDLKAAVRKLLFFRRRLLSYDWYHYESALQVFRIAFETAFRGAYAVPGYQSGLPFVKLLPGNVALIGVDSNYLLPRLLASQSLIQAAWYALRTHDLSKLGVNLSGSTGWVDIRALDLALSCPEIRSRRKIVLMHHYLYDAGHIASKTSEAYAQEMRLINRDAVVDILSKHGVDLVLHGHEHVLDEYDVAGGAKALNGGGATPERFAHIDVSTSAMNVSYFDDRIRRDTMYRTKGISLT